MMLAIRDPREDAETAGMPGKRACSSYFGQESLPRPLRRLRQVPALSHLTLFLMTHSPGSEARA